jgi:hypothetical protein
LLNRIQRTQQVIEGRAGRSLHQLSTEAVVNRVDGLYADYLKRRDEQYLNLSIAGISGIHQFFPGYSYETTPNWHRFIHDQTDRLGGRRRR